MTLKKIRDEAMMLRPLLMLPLYLRILLMWPVVFSAVSSYHGAYAQIEQEEQLQTPEELPQQSPSPPLQPQPQPQQQSPLSPPPETIPVGMSPLGIAFNPENGDMYVTNFYSG